MKRLFWTQLSRIDSQAQHHRRLSFQFSWKQLIPYSQCWASKERHNMQLNLHKSSSTWMVTRTTKTFQRNNNNKTGMRWRKTNFPLHGVLQERKEEKRKKSFLLLAFFYRQQAFLCRYFVFIFERRRLFLCRKSEKKYRKAPPTSSSNYRCISFLSNSCSMWNFSGSN
jgi:hypothetical protein